jgi:DNA processing protein
MNTDVNNSKYKYIEKKDFHKYKVLKNLLEINQIPEKLCLYGNEKLLNSDAKVLCVVGSRKSTSYGKEAVDFLLSGLQGENIIIVSGLALGTDSNAHKTALKYKLKTISFPGSGLDNDVLYPAANVKLADDIVMHDGLLVSEYECDSRSQIYYFPARNRLMAAISDLVLVVEAEEKSGTQITARLALEYNKEVAIVPGSIFSAYSRGTAKLFKDGAHPVTSSQDILDLLQLSDENFPEKLKSASLFEAGENIKNKQDFNDKLFESLSEQENAIMKLLKSPLQKEDVFDNADFPMNQILIALTNLESKGFIKDNFGEIIRVK